MTGAHSIIITAEKRASTEKGLALYQGAKHEMTDERTGEIVEREHWHWLSHRHAKIVREWRARDGKKLVEVELPEWLAKKAGLA